MSAQTRAREFPRKFRLARAVFAQHGNGDTERRAFTAGKFLRRASSSNTSWPVAFRPMSERGGREPLKTGPLGPLTSTVGP